MNTVSLNLQNKSVYGVGAALVDLLAQVDAEWITGTGTRPGDMEMVDEARSTELVSSLGAIPVEVPGGSACNTLVGIALMGGSAAFAGKIGRDRLGQVFTDHLVKCGVQADLVLSATTATGRVLSAVTPDAQRTMFTHLGASAELSPVDLSAWDPTQVGLVHVEGYLAFNEPVFRAVMDRARQIGVPVCLDLASPSVVQFCRPLLEETLASGVITLLVANEDEGAAWCKTDDESQILVQMAESCSVAVLKLGVRGAQIGQRGQPTLAVAAQVVPALDTTGAGDLWAAGFLRGLQRGWDLERCARLGAAVAAEVVQVLGTVIPPAGWERISAFTTNLADAR